MRPTDAALVLLTAATLGFAGLWQIEKWSASSDRVALAAMKAEALIESIDSAGWELRVVEATEGLEEQLRESRDSTALLFQEKAELAAQVQTFDGRIAVLMDMYAGAVGQIEEHGTVHVAEGQEVTPDTSPDSITAPINDGLLSGRLKFTPPDSLGIDYALRLALALGVVDLPDGRQLLNAKASDARVALRFGDVFVQKPEPVAFCSIGTKAKYTGIGAGVLALFQQFTN